MQWWHRFQKHNWNHREERRLFRADIAQTLQWLKNSKCNGFLTLLKRFGKHCAWTSEEIIILAINEKLTHQKFRLKFRERVATLWDFLNELREMFATLGKIYMKLREKVTHLLKICWKLRESLQLFVNFTWNWEKFLHCPFRCSL